MNNKYSFGFQNKIVSDRISMNRTSFKDPSRQNITSEYFNVLNFIEISIIVRVIGNLYITTLIVRVLMSLVKNATEFLRYKNTYLHIKCLNIYLINKR